MRYGRMLNADPGKVSSRAKKWGAQRGEKHHPASTTFGGYIVIQQQGAWIISKNGMGITVCLSIWWSDFVLVLHGSMAIDFLYPFAGGSCSPNPIHLDMAWIVVVKELYGGILRMNKHCSCSYSHRRPISPIPMGSGFQQDLTGLPLLWQHALFKWQATCQERSHPRMVGLSMVKLSMSPWSILLCK